MMRAESIDFVKRPAQGIWNDYYVCEGKPEENGKLGFCYDFARQFFGVEENKDLPEKIHLILASVPFPADRKSQKVYVRCWQTGSFPLFDWGWTRADTNFAMFSPVCRMLSRMFPHAVIGDVFPVYVTIERIDS